VARAKATVARAALGEWAQTGTAVQEARAALGGQAEAGRTLVALEPGEAGPDGPGPAVVQG
jgi:hypothetical protein